MLYACRTCSKLPVLDDPIITQLCGIWDSVPLFIRDVSHGIYSRGKFNIVSFVASLAARADFIIYSCSNTA